MSNIYQIGPLNPPEGDLKDYFKNLNMEFLISAVIKNACYQN